MLTHNVDSTLAYTVEDRLARVVGEGWGGGGGKGILVSVVQDKS